MIPDDYIPFMRAIARAHPDDEVPYLIFADFLEDHDYEWAKLIRDNQKTKEVLISNRVMSRIAMSYFPTIERIAMRGGMISSLDVTVSQWLVHGPSIVNVWPIRDVALRINQDSCGEFYYLETPREFLPYTTHRLNTTQYRTVWAWITAKYELDDAALAYAKHERDKADARRVCQYR